MIRQLYRVLTDTKENVMIYARTQSGGIYANKDNEIWKNYMEIEFPLCCEVICVLFVANKSW